LARPNIVLTLTDHHARHAHYRPGEMDVTATMLDAAGMDVPSTMHSRSLLPLCTGGASDGPDEVVSEHHGHGATLLTQRMIARGRHKYVAALYDGDELYDLEAAPYEMHNLADDPHYAPLAGEPRTRLLDHIERTDDRVARRRLLVALEHADAGPP